MWNYSSIVTSLAPTEPTAYSNGTANFTELSTKKQSGITTVEQSTKHFHYVYSPVVDRDIYTMLPGIVASKELQVTLKSSEVNSNITEFGDVANANMTCDELYQNFIIQHELFLTRVRITKITLTWIIFTLSMIGNCFVLYSLTLGRKRRRMSHAQIMMFHLTCANLMFTAVILPMDGFWNITVEWYGGEFMCRVLNVFKQFAMYISSAVIVVMGMDRAAGLMCQVSSEYKRRRMKLMFRGAWIVSFLNAIPAGVFFSVIHYTPYNETCPEHYFRQCVDFVLLPGPKRYPYLMFTWLVSFFGPLICILLCYIFIAISISKLAKLSKGTEHSMPNQQNKTRRSLDRARRISQLVVGLITATFILCWGPYYVVGFIDWFWVEFHNGKELLGPMVNVLMLMSMYLSPCLHPVITVLLMKEVRTNIKTQLHVSKSSIVQTFRMSNNGVQQQQQKNHAQQHRIPTQRKLRKTFVNKNKKQDTEVILMDECENKLLNNKY